MQIDNETDRHEDRRLNQIVPKNGMFIHQTKPDNTDYYIVLLASVGLKLNIYYSGIK